MYYDDCLIREYGIFILHISQTEYIVKVLHILYALELFADNMHDKESCNKKLFHLFDDGFNCLSLQQASNKCLELMENNQALSGGIHELWIN